MCEGRPVPSYVASRALQGSSQRVTTRVMRLTPYWHIPLLLDVTFCTFMETVRCSFWRARIFEWARSSDPEMFVTSWKQACR